MATAYLRAESVPVILPENFSQAAAVMAQFDRKQLASAIEVLVNLLDVLDGDPDAENATDLEDDFSLTNYAAMDDGPGCRIADAGGQCDEDDFNTHLGAAYGELGAGCELSDPDYGCDDEGEVDYGEYDYPGHLPGGGSGPY